MKKKFIIAGNWKMNKTVSESISFIKELKTKLDGIKNNSNFGSLEIIIFPPYTSLFPLKDISPFISIGSQNIFYEEKGAFTGEISPVIVKEIARYALIGHSERREIFGEKDGNMYTLTIKDNGVGLPENYQSSNSLGLKLVKGLSKQLNGEFIAENSTKGASFSLKFKV